MTRRQNDLSPLSELASRTSSVIRRIPLLIQTIQSGQFNSYKWYAWQWWVCRLFPKRLNISFSKWQVWQASSKFHVHTWWPAWVVAESGVVMTPRGMHLIYICVHIFAAPLWPVGLTNPKQFSVIYSFIDHIGMVWKCSKLKWNQVVSLQSDRQRKTNCMVWFDVNPRVGLPRSGKSQARTKIFQGQGKSLILSKSVNCQRILFSGL